MKPPTAILQVSAAVLEAVSPEGVPSGQLYVHLMNVMPLLTYETLIGTLEVLEAIRVKNHYITRGEEYDKVLANFKRSLK